MTEAFSPRGIYYRTNEFKDRPTLVFVHGLTGSSSAWFPYEREFEDDYNLLTFDLRGHGQSNKPKHYRDYAISEFVADLEDLIERLAIKEFNLISHSFGTVIALPFLAKHHSRIRSAMLLSPVFDAKKLAWARLANFFLGGVAKFMTKIPFSGKRGVHIDYQKYENTGDWNLRRMAADIPNTSVHVYAYCLNHIYHFNGEPLLKDIFNPTLVLHGKQDSVMPLKTVLPEIEKIKDHELVVLDHANHILVINNIPEVTENLRNFLISKTS